MYEAGPEAVRILGFTKDRGALRQALNSPVDERPLRALVRARLAGVYAQRTAGQALARAESSLVALFIYLQPLIAGVLSAILLGERPCDGMEV